MPVLAQATEFAFEKKKVAITLYEMYTCRIYMRLHACQPEGA